MTTKKPEIYHENSGKPTAKEGDRKETKAKFGSFWRSALPLTSGNRSGQVELEDRHSNSIGQGSTRVCDRAFRLYSVRRIEVGEDKVSDERRTKP